MKFYFHPQAAEEFSQAVDYYEEIKPGLGHEFATEVYAAIERCVKFPKAWPILKENIRRSLVKRFPFGILYVEDLNNKIFILAVMNLYREPDYWKHRKK